MKYPDVHVTLTGENGNALNLVGQVSNALHRAGVSREEISDFAHEALSGDYDHVLATCEDWVDVS